MKFFINQPKITLNQIKDLKNKTEAAKTNSKTCISLRPHSLHNFRFSYFLLAFQFQVADYQFLNFTQKQFTASSLLLKCSCIPLRQITYITVASVRHLSLDLKLLPLLLLIEYRACLTSSSEKGEQRANC